MSGRDYGVECERCDWYRRVGGTICDVHHRLATLAHNLAWAASLCEAFWQGWEEREHHDLYSSHGYRTEQDWRPGCQRPARSEGS
jgi:hypothetical protein